MCVLSHTDILSQHLSFTCACVINIFSLDLMNLPSEVTILVLHKRGQKVGKPRTGCKVDRGHALWTVHTQVRFTNSAIKVTIYTDNKTTGGLYSEQSNCNSNLTVDTLVILLWLTAPKNLSLPSLSPPLALPPKIFSRCVCVWALIVFVCVCARLYGSACVYMFSIVLVSAHSSENNSWIFLYGSLQPCRLQLARS